MVGGQNGGGTFLNIVTQLDISQMNDVIERWHVISYLHKNSIKSNVD